MAVSLTEIPNRESLERALAAHLENGRTVSAVFIDLDGFKQVNDQYGHDEGDRCLVEVATVMAKVIDAKGRVYRVGGDEFCIMLPNLSGSDATVNAEHVRLSIDRLKPFGGATKVTASIGVATSCAKLTDAKALIAAADDAMYVSKWTTKNCVTTWPPLDTARNRADIAKLHYRCRVGASDNHGSRQKRRG
jgi:diguanylate cyclase (GGDEF)-like protein